MQETSGACGASTDVITVLRSNGPELRKTWRAGGEIAPYSLAKYFTPREVPLDGIKTLSVLLDKLERSPHKCVIRGRWRGAAVSREMDSEHREGFTRRLAGLFEDVRHHWVMIEVDRYRPVFYDPVEEPEAACLEYIEAALPECFHGVSFHWQLSNSAGHERNRGVLKAHIWFWLERPYNSAELWEWATAERVDLDRSVLNVVQVHYTSAPGFDEGVVDPVLTRSGLYRGVLGDAVPLAIDEDVLSAVANRALRVTERTGKPVDLGRLSQMVYALDADMAYPDWIKVGQALHFETGGGAEGLALWDDWSSRSGKYEPGLCAEKWGTFRDEGERLVGQGTLIRMAEAAGWSGVGDDDFMPLGEVTALLAAGAAPAATGDGAAPAPLDPPNFERVTAERSPDFGRPKHNLENLVLALERPDLVGVRLAYDEFTAEYVYQPVNNGRGWEPFKDGLVTWLQLRLEDRGLLRFVPTKGADLLVRAMKAVAENNTVDTAREWLNSLPPWDGVERLKDLFAVHCYPRLPAGADERYPQALGLYVGSAMAGRVIDPGCRAEIMPILIGAQGKLKTEFVKALAPDERFYAESHMHNIDHPDSARLLRGRLISEVSELRGFGTKEIESIKAFITRHVDQFVDKYDKFATTYARRCIFIGTTNDEHFLNDPTGSRRFAPLVVGDGGRAIDTDWVRQNRDQLWAEGAVLYRAKGIQWQDVMRWQSVVNPQHETIDPWEEPIARWLDAGGQDEATAFEDYHGAAKRPDKVTISSVLRYALNIPVGQHNLANTKRVAAILKKEGYEKARMTTKRYRGRKFWVHSDL